MNDLIQQGTLSRDNLRNKVIAAFSAQDEVYRICLFGKEAQGEQDAYSDIDLIVYSNDAQATRDHLDQTLNSIAPVMAVLPLGGGADWYAQTMMFDSYSLYHKVDFSIGCGLDLSKLTLQVVYDCPSKARESLSNLEPLTIQPDVAYQLNEALFAVPRFTKCLFRQDFDMYRRWVGMTNQLCAILYEKQFGWQPGARAKLSPPDYRALYASLSPKNRSRLAKVMPLNARVELASSYTVATDWLIELSREKACYLSVLLNDAWIDTVQTFLHVEMERIAAFSLNQN